MSTNSQLLSPQRLKALQAVMLVKEAHAEQLCVRLFGSVAIWQHCPSLRACIEARRPTPFKDMDFVGRLSEKSAIEAFFERRLWETDKSLATVPGARSSIFYQKRNGAVVGRCDMSYDILDFCHPIDCRSRMQIDPVTLPLAELALSKLQVNKMSLNDIFDLTMLFLDHNIAPGDDETINISIIQLHCLASWGLYTTLTQNVTVLLDALPGAGWLTTDQRDIVGARLSSMKAKLSATPKSLRWRLRNLVGTHMRWYEEVEAAGLSVGDPIPS